MAHCLIREKGMRSGNLYIRGWPGSLSTSANLATSDVESIAMTVIHLVFCRNPTNRNTSIWLAFCATDSIDACMVFRSSTPKLSCRVNTDLKSATISCILGNDVDVILFIRCWSSISSFFSRGDITLNEQSFIAASVGFVGKSFRWSMGDVRIVVEQDQDVHTYAHSSTSQRIRTFLVFIYSRTWNSFDVLNDIWILWYKRRSEIERTVSLRHKSIFDVDVRHWVCQTKAVANLFYLPHTWTRKIPQHFWRLFPSVPKVPSRTPVGIFWKL